MADYFSHDYGARNDPKLIRLQMVMGQEGKGIFWDLIEIMYEQNGFLLLSQIDCYAFSIKTDSDKLKRLITEFDLFTTVGDRIENESVKRRLSIREAKSIKSLESINHRWKNDGIQKKIRTYYERNTIKDSIVKDSKVNIYTSDFESFWNAYPKKTGKGAAWKAWNKIPSGTLPLILTSLEWQVKSEQWIKEHGQFIPMPSTYLNQSRWEDQPTEIKLKNDDSFFPKGCWRPPQNAKI